ncbi:nucleotidyltransferase domain-containing protein [Mongoliimonas terrestris]|uniref:nucleotidyltransferase domain-containing protein n=1 Tax=Mongoliimonas terrestris TaxID=1709001 RepID=UPI000949A906|nr:nucleotidyltransferase domain-containing protein [Mongoliimonas terrestris]
MSPASANLAQLAEPPTPAAVAAALDHVAGALSAHYGPRLDRAVLFGSRARGDARPESDADVAVVLAPGDWSPWQEKVALLPITEQVLDRWGLYVQFWILGADAWTDPASAADLVRAARRDAKPLGPA